MHSPPFFTSSQPHHRSAAHCSALAALCCAQLLCRALHFCPASAGEVEGGGGLVEHGVGGLGGGGEEDRATGKGLAEAVGDAARDGAADLAAVVQDEHEAAGVGDRLQPLKPLERELRPDRRYAQLHNTLVPKPHRPTLHLQHRRHVLLLHRPIL
eukprot:CAMPEP_0202817834 /NCGR_PEP_ID=MMETSP1389-20130828/7927_1 /ASSEMBLY_ACC=CAM_ASM_000865 /TAXON_ID=302021 /ORGANISM="Rhodomonas sp., Strain CCMP768" /LENGTH=154 /DNA_ID=CAMNT_0049490113 /DNA_START=268 /DNA_END=729 /DNA_ORIENTATION=+